MNKIDYLIYKQNKIVDFIEEGKEFPKCHSYDASDFGGRFPRYYKRAVSDTFAEIAFDGEGMRFINVMTSNELEEKAANTAAELKAAAEKEATEKESLAAYVNEENARLEAIASGKELYEINEIDLRRLWSKIGATWVVQFQTALIFGKKVPVTEGDTKFK